MELGKLKEALRIDKWFSAVANLLNALTRAFVIIALILYFVLSGPHGLESGQRYAIILLLIFVLTIIIAVEALLSLHWSNPLGAPGERDYLRSRNRGLRYGSDSHPKQRSKSLRQKSKTASPEILLPPKKPKAKQLSPPKHSKGQEPNQLP